VEHFKHNFSSSELTSTYLHGLLLKHLKVRQRMLIMRHKLHRAA
jgi:hypothetical protein